MRQPLPGLWGELDCQLSAYDSAAAVRASLDRSGHANYTLVMLPRADHSITLVGPCAQETTGWNVLRHDYPGSYFGLLAEWVHEHDQGTAPVRRLFQPDQPTPSKLGWYQAPTTGAGLVGGFVPQMALIVGLLAAFGTRTGAGVVRSTLSLLRRQRPRLTLAGATAGLGLLAMLLAIASLGETLLLGSTDNIRPIGALVLGVTPLFVLASAAVTATLALGLASFARMPVRRSIGAALVVATLVAFAAWSAYWTFLPAWLVPGLG